MSKIFIVCSGLGMVNRGYESFARECYEALASDSSLHLTLVQGGETSIPGSITLPNLPRNHPWAKLVGRLLSFNPALRDPYTIEQLTFFVSLIPKLYQYQPDVIFLSDFILTTLLWHWRRLSKLNYKLLFSNGAPNGPPFSRMDYVQHLTPTHYQEAIDAGEPPQKHTLVPYGIHLNSQFIPLTLEDKVALRGKLNLPEKRIILLSVGALNNSHKRMNYLIQEVANLRELNPYLVLLGQQDQESKDVLNLAQKCLGEQNCCALTVAPEQVREYYQAADIFVLASLREGLPRVFLEAMSYGLPCIAHDYPVSRFVLGDQACFGNLRESGALADLLPEAYRKSQDIHYQRYQHQAVYRRFSWESLTTQYVEMIQNCSICN